MESIDVSAMNSVPTSQNDLTTEKIPVVNELPSDMASTSSDKNEVHLSPDHNWTEMLSITLDDKPRYHGRGTGGKAWHEGIRDSAVLEDQGTRDVRARATIERTDARSFNESKHTKVL